MERYKLGELIDVTRGASLPGDNYATEGELIRLTLGNFDYKSNGFKENTSKDDIYYNGEVDDEYILEKGDIITPLTEQAIGLLGSTAKVPESGKYIQSQDVALVKVKSDKLVHDFAYYLLPTASVKKQLSAGAQQTSIRHTSPDKIKDCTVYLPEPKDQQKIADFLNQIEDKIALNRKENATLEAMAKQLYDYWFVQFDFPDANGRPYKSSGGKMVWNETLKREIPEGWVDCKISECILPFERGISYTSENIKNGLGVPMINLACFDKEGNYRTGELKYFEGEYDEGFKVFPDDMLIATTDMTRNADIIGTPIWVNREYDSFLFTTDLVKLAPKQGVEAAFIYFTLKDKSYHRYIKPFASGTNVMHLNTQGILDYKFAFAPYDIQLAFSELYADFKKAQDVCVNQIRELSQLIDEILPLLMANQVRIDI